MRPRIHELYPDLVMPESMQFQRAVLFGTFFLSYCFVALVKDADILGLFDLYEFCF